MDRRQKKTREAIFTAFVKLLAQKSYHRVTVQEIVDAANVGRTTFYAHFPTRDDLLRELCEDLFRHVFSDAPPAEVTHDFSLAAGSPQERLTHVLYHLRDSGRNLIAVLTGESSGAFLPYLRNSLAGLFGAWLSDDPADIPRDFCCAICATPSSAWCNGGCATAWPARRRKWPLGFGLWQAAALRTAFVLGSIDGPPRFML